MEKLKLNIIEFHILRYLLKHEGETVLVKDVANFNRVSKQTASKYINRHVYCGDIQRDGKTYSVVNPYLREVLANG